MEEEQEEEWEEARIVFAKLIGISKSQHQITAEYKDTEAEEWVTESFDLAKGITKEDFESLRSFLDSDVKLEVEDNTVVSWSNPR